jgi:hypothetical protein
MANAGGKKMEAKKIQRTGEWGLVELGLTHSGETIGALLLVASLPTAE